MATTDRIEKKTFLRAPRGRVWTALTDFDQFGRWFGVKLETAFSPGAHVKGKMTNPDYAHLTIELWIERVEPQRLFSYRWHPYAIDPNVDYSKEPTTLVEFTLAEADGGTALTIVESGFDAIPVARRAKALEMNTGGWEWQAKRIAEYVGDAK